MNSFENSLLEAMPGETPKQKYDNFLIMKNKAEKWDALDKKIASYYPEDLNDIDETDNEEGGDLADIGEAAAMAFGYL